jgi:hypothetical protein
MRLHPKEQLDSKEGCVVLWAGRSAPNVGIGGLTIVAGPKPDDP